MKQTALALGILTMIAAAASGCLEESSAPVQSNLALLFPVGSTATYEIGPDWSTRIETSLIVTHDVDGWKHQYEYQGYPELDTEVKLSLTDTGSVAHATTNCLPRAPIEGVSQCARLRSEIWQIGTYAPLFGLTLFANSPLTSSGFERVVQWGQFQIEAQIAVRAIGDNQFELSPANAATSQLGEPDSSYFDAFGNCNVLEHRVIYDAKLKLPTACWRDEEQSSGARESFGWTLVSQKRASGNALNFSPLTVSPVSAGQPDIPKEPSENPLPIGLREALEFLKSQNAEARTFLEQDFVIRQALLATSGGSTTGPCPACLSYEAWSWTLQIQGPDRLLHAKIEKNVSNLSPRACSDLGACTLSELSFESYESLPRIYPDLQVNLGEVWRLALPNGTPGYLRVRSIELETGHYDVWVEVHLRGSDANFPSPHLTIRSDGLPIARFQPI